MAKSIVFCLFFVSAAYSLNETESPLALSVCSQEGFKCIDSCTKLVRCFINGNNSFSQQVVRNCPSDVGKLCNLSSRDCTSSFCEDENLDKQPIICHEDGIYPNPSNCSGYYTCLGGVLDEKLCPKGTAYNGAFGNCTADVLNERPCMERPIPMCSSIGEIGPYKENSTIFYICSYNSAGYLLPQLRKCQSMYHFDPEEKRCNSGGVIFASLTAIVLAFVFVVNAK